MKLQQIPQLILNPARRQAVEKVLQSPVPFRALFTSLAGSAPALIMASVPKAEKPVIVVGDSPDDAGYLYHDLCD